MNLRNNNPRIALSLVLTGVCLVSIHFSTSIFAAFEPDSQGYIAFDPYRTAIYPILLELFLPDETNRHYLFAFQIFLYLVSFAFLIHTVSRTYCSWFISGALGIALGCNVYIQAYHTVVLTESITFSLSNILLGIMVCNRHKMSVHTFFGVGLLAGLMAAMRPALFPFVGTVPLALYFLVPHPRNVKIKGLLGLCGGIILVFLFEASIFYSHHEKRESLAPLTLIGKAAIITTSENFEHPELPNRQMLWLNEMDAEFDPIQSWMRREGSLLVRSNLRSNFEVLGQYQLLTKLRNNPSLPKLTDQEQIDLGISVILKNWNAYIENSVGHLVSLWMVFDLQFLNIVFGKELPEFNEVWLNSAIPGASSGHPLFSLGKHDPIALLSLLVFPAFLVLAVCSICFSVLTWALVLIASMKSTAKRSQNAPMLIAWLFFIGWAYLIFVAFVNIATPRYLMPVMPFFLLAVLLCLRKYFFNFFMVR